MGSLDYLLIRILPQEPSGQMKARKLTLRMARRHVDNQPLQLTTSHPLKRPRHKGMMLTLNEPRPGSLYEL